jgi:hypothetical protein
MPFAFRALISSALAVIATSLTACGGAVLEADGDAGTSRAGDAATSLGDDDASAAPDASTVDSGVVDQDGGELTYSGCPSTPPDEATSCDAPFLACEYGSSPHIVCNEVATCIDGEWSYPPPTPGPPSPFCVPPNPLCPTTFRDTPASTTCATAPDIVCDYPSGSCGCLGGGPYPNDGGAPNYSWFCSVPSPGCSATRPLLGTLCTDDGQECEYAVCIDDGGDFESCEGGVWVRTPPPNMTPCAELPSPGVGGGR